MRRFLFGLLFFVALLGAAGWAVLSPQSPVPSRYSLAAPLDLSAAPGPLDAYKLRRAIASGPACLAALETGARFEAQPPLDGEGQCGIATRIRLSAVGETTLPPLETACQTALRLAMWERDSLRPLAAAFDVPVTGLSHQGSYNCRAIRGGTRLSSHATARAIDIRALRLADGSEIPLLGNWQGEGREAQLWRALRDGACGSFTTVLGPDFNAAHADHLHLQSGGWGTCR